MRRSKKNKRALKRPDLSNIREALKDQRAWCCLGLVQDSEDGSPHFDLDGEDLTVEVEFQPSGEQVTARVGTIGGTFGAGIWIVPPVGAEVMVMIPDGEIDFQPTVVGMTSSGSMPENVSENVVVIAAPAGGEVYVHDGSGPVEPLVKKSEYDSLKTYLDAHVHPTGVGPSGPPSTPTPDAPGTSILKAK